MEITWKEKDWNAITRDELYSFSRLRINVFVVEQDCPYPEFDDKDQQSIHLWGEDNDGKTLVYLRIVNPGVSYPEVSIGRVVVDGFHRKEGLGRKIMIKAMDTVYRRFGKVPVRISAQEYLIEFYESLGFVVEGEGYLEDGIPHIEMLHTP